MSQTETAPTERVSKPILSELSAQTISDKCNALARNLWWTWHPEVINLFRDLDPIRSDSGFREFKRSVGDETFERGRRTLKQKLDKLGRALDDM